MPSRKIDGIRSFELAYRDNVGAAHDPSQQNVGLLHQDLLIVEKSRWHFRNYKDELELRSSFYELFAVARDNARMLQSALGYKIEDLSAIKVSSRFDVIDCHI